MNRFLSFVIGLILAAPSLCQEVITSFEFSRTFNIQKDSSTGTSFLISDKQKNYWVTAKHMLGSVRNKQKITFKVLKDSTWLIVVGTVLLHANSQVDLAIIQPDDTLSIDAIKLDQASVAPGEEGVFLGFPLGLKTKDYGNINKGFPFALIKKCVFSGSYLEKGINILFLDGHNNPGFSGGPVFFKNPDNPNDRKLYLLGVISAYINQKNQMITPIGTFDYDENSGIILVYPTNYIKEILTQNGK